MKIKLIILFYNFGKEKKMSYPVERLKGRSPSKPGMVLTSVSEKTTFAERSRTKNKCKHIEYLVWGLRPTNFIVKNLQNVSVSFVQALFKTNYLNSSSTFLLQDITWSMGSFSFAVLFNKINK